jgi:hypothetical protein
MPPYMAIPYFHLSKLPPTTKVAVTGFSASFLAAVLFVAFAVFAERTGYRTKNVQANFRGDEAVTRETGEKFDRMHAEPSRRAIYDIVHPHSFLMPVIYFILCHLMEMSRAPRGLKMALYLAALASMLLVVFAPLLVWTRLSLACLVVPSVVVMLLCFSVMAVVPVWQMWRGGRDA